MVTDSMNARDRLRAVIPGPWHGWLVVPPLLDYLSPFPQRPRCLSQEKRKWKP